MEISGSPGRRGNTFRSDTGGRRLRKPPRIGSHWFPRSNEGVTMKCRPSTPSRCDAASRRWRMRQFGMAEHDNQLEAAVEAVQSVGCCGTSSAGSCQCQDRMAERRIREEVVAANRHQPRVAPWASGILRSSGSRLRTSGCRLRTRPLGARHNSGDEGERSASPTEFPGDFASGRVCLCR